MINPDPLGTYSLRLPRSVPLPGIVPAEEKSSLFPVRPEVRPDEKFLPSNHEGKGVTRLWSQRVELEDVKPMTAHFLRAFGISIAVLGGFDSTTSFTFLLIP